MKAVIGDSAWGTWLANAIPHSDDGEILDLSVSNNFTKMHVKETFGEVLEEILGRRLVLTVRGYVIDALLAREAKAKARQPEGVRERG